MTLHIPDDVLERGGLTEREVRVELACRLFDMGRIELWPASQLAGLSRLEMEEELANRKIPIYRPTVDDLRSELAAIEALEAKRANRGE